MFFLLEVTNYGRLLLLVMQVSTLKYNISVIVKWVVKI